MAYLPEQQNKRYKSDGDDVVVMEKPAAPRPLLVQDELADKFKLAQAKEFAIQGNPNGKILGCGVEVRAFPDSRFRIRIYDRDRNNAGKLRTFIEMSLDDFLRIKRYEDRIKCCLNYVRHHENILRYDDFSIKVVSSNQSGQRPMVEFYKPSSKIYMTEETFMNMMSYEETLKSQYTEFKKRISDDKQFLDDLLNVMAFKRNEGRVNDYVNEPAEWYQAGTVTTWNKFVDQVSKSKERMKKKARTSDNISR